jgi:hypothetical protein
LKTWHNPCNADCPCVCQMRTTIFLHPAKEPMSAEEASCDVCRRGSILDRTLAWEYGTMDAVGNCRHKTRVTAKTNMDLGLPPNGKDKC